MSDDVRGKIQRFILENYLFTDDPAAFGADESLLKQGIVDSTGIMEIILFMEDLGVLVEDHEMIPDNFDSLNKIVRFAHAKLQAA